MLNRFLSWLFGGDARTDSMRVWQGAKADMRRLVWRAQAQAWTPRRHLQG